MAVDKAGLVAAIKCQAGFNTWTDTALGNESRPIPDRVTWYEALGVLYFGCMLPTEAEWNFVAAGAASNASIHLVGTSRNEDYHRGPSQLLRGRQPAMLRGRCDWLHGS